MENIIEKIKNNIDNPLLISIAGSYAWGMQNDNSDKDYFSIVEGKDKKIPDEEILLKKINDIDIFYLTKNSIENISCCSSLLFLQNINNTIYASSSMCSFLKDNKKSFLNINPKISYKLTLQSIEEDKKYKEQLQYRQIQFSEVLKNFYYYGDFSKSLKLSDEIKNLCRKLKDGKKVLSESELNQYLEIIYTPSFKDYFYTFEPNTKLHQEFIKILNEGGELNDITQ